MPPAPLLIAHRGMPRRERENTLPSFRAALHAGADAIELDVHATPDGVVKFEHKSKTRLKVSVYPEAASDTTTAA
jgi:glycerophosphoryl diester phosphodiesterase